MTNKPESSAPSPPKGQEAIRAIETPLAGVDSRSLDALMAEDVESLADADVDRIVAELRRVRASWEASEAERAAKPKGRAKAEPGDKPKVNISLEDLGF